ncbi:MAG TPA: PAS domain S-box protein [Chloroflexi bacterium]|nr:PAS domain S-box protein [Chloroflexota bacterium]
MTGNPAPPVSHTQEAGGERQLLPSAPGDLDRERMRFVYAEAPIILYELAADGRIMSLSDAFESITGWPVAAWIGRNFLDLIAPEDQALARQEFARACRGETRNYRRMHLIAADGNTLTVEIQGLKLAIAGTTGVYGFVRDITELVRTEEQLRQQAAFLASVSDAIIVTDPAFHVVEWNPAAESIYGWQRREVIGKSLVGILGTEYVDTTQDAVLDEFLRTGQWRGEVMQRRKDGSRLHILASVNATYDARGRRSGAVAINRDITAEVNARQALTRIERIYRQAISGIGGVPYLRDYRTPGYSFIGGEIESLTGYHPDELTGALFTSRLRKIEAYDEYAGLSREERIAKARQGSGIVWREDYLFERKDGSLVWLADHAVPVHDEQGKVIGSLGILLDITARKQAAEEQRRLQERVAQMERLEMVGQLAGGVAHDFNNMLAVILMRAEMALLQVDVLSPLHRHLTEIHKTAQRSAELTRQLLGFARRQPIAPRALDLNQVIQDALPMLRHLLGEAITLNWQPGDALGTVFMDPTQIHQILINLCVNARDAITGSGEVTIATHNAELDEAYSATHPDVRPGAYSVLSVSDTGCGMTPDVLEHIFEPFFTTKEVGRGTGLGLATLYGIVQQNHGHIAVESTPQVGTSFHIFLPHHQAKPAPDTPTPASQAGSATILVVEDNIDLLEMAAEGLRKIGYQVFTAASAGEAHRLARLHAGAIDLLLTDVIMPEEDGVALARRLHSHCPSLRVLYVSGHPVHLLEQRGVLTAGAQVLRKPFTLAEMAAAVEKALLTEDRKEDVHSATV